MNVEITMGQQMLANSISQTCFIGTDPTSTMAAICVSARAGDEDGRLSAGGVQARWIPREEWTIESQPQSEENIINGDEDMGMTALPAAAWRGEKDEDGEYGEPRDVIEALNKGSAVSAKWYQPSSSSAYEKAPRYEAGMEVVAYGAGLGAEEDSWNVSQQCMTATLTGASTLIAGAALAFGAVAMF